MFLDEEPTAMPADDTATEETATPAADEAATTEENA